MRALRLVSGFLLLLSSVSVARAQDPHPRRGTLMAVAGDTVGVWLGSRRIWAPGGAAYLSACAPGRGCAPVVESTACATPECPGGGTVYTTARDVASVGGFPSGYDGYQDTIEALRVDPFFSAIAGYLSNHPEHSEREEARREAERAQRREEQRHEESVRWVSRYRDGDRWELGLSGAVATLAEQGGSYAGGTASFGLAFQLDDDDSDEDDEDSVIFGIFFGDTFGADLRVHFLHRLDEAQQAQWITAVGIAPTLANRFEDSVVRLPTFYGVVAPEFGAIFRADRDPTWYMAWDVPVSLLVTHDFAVDFAARLMVVDEWIELPDDAPEDADDPAEVILSLSAGFRLP